MTCAVTSAYAVAVALPPNHAARVGDPQSCPLTVPAPHGGGPLAGPGVATVQIGHLPAAVEGTPCPCAGLPNAIGEGSASVTIGYRGAARVGDPTTHLGSIIAGCTSVIIG